LFFKKVYLMSHELTIRESGKVEMAYAAGGETPWHGLGDTWERGASIETIQRVAGMDWKIQKGIVRFATEFDQDGQHYGQMPDKHVLFRSDNKTPLGVVSDKYKVVQPKAVLEFFRDLTEQYGYELDTAGTLFGGSRFWALASTPDFADVGKGDKIKRYLLLSTSADGTMKTQARNTCVRVVCNNTLSLSHSIDAAAFSLSHRTAFDVDKAKEKMQIGAHSEFERHVTMFRKLADTRMLSDDVIKNTVTLFKPNAAALAKEEYIKVLNSKPVTRVMELALDGAARGSTLDGVAGTAWGWLNAVTEYVDHESRARSVDNRLNSAWFGKGDDLKNRALALVTADCDELPARMPDLLGDVVAKFAASRN
jgi:phage/plasmid-like protein (TIGR03299 family)